MGLFPKDKQLPELRSSRSGGIEIAGREFDWWAALEAIAGELGLRRRAEPPPDDQQEITGQARKGR